MNLPKVSIITVVYNAKDLFEKTISNIISLKYPNKEIIVIDGGSTDGTRTILEKNYLEIDIWISEPDNGIYDAMNKALRIATGEYVWFINAGDLTYSPYVLEDIFKGRDVCHDIYYGETLIVNENNKVLGLRKKKLPRNLTQQSFLNGMVVCHQSFIARRKLLNAFDLKYRHSADYEQMIKAVRDAKSICRINNCLSVFMEGGHTSTHRKAGLKERFEIMNRHFGFLKTIIAHIKITFKAPFSNYRINKH